MQELQHLKASDWVFQIFGPTSRLDATREPGEPGAKQRSWASGSIPPALQRHLNMVTGMNLASIPLSLPLASTTGISHCSRRRTSGRTTNLDCNSGLSSSTRLTVCSSDSQGQPSTGQLRVTVLGRSLAKTTRRG